jgi:hypothetical protein
MSIGKGKELRTEVIEQIQHQANIFVTGLASTISKKRVLVISSDAYSILRRI